MKGQHWDSKLKGGILDVCEDIASPLVAACLYGPRSHGRSINNGEINVLIITDQGKPILKSHRGRVADFSGSFLVIDRENFERDAENGALGELAVENIFTPYKPLICRDYLRRQEVIAKKRIISGLLDNLVLEFPELSYDLYIKPEYFIYEAVTRMASLLPPLTYGLINMLRGGLEEENVRSMMEGIKTALAELAEEEKITLHRSGYVRIGKDYIETVKARRAKIADIFRSFKKEVLHQILRVFPRLTLSIPKDQETYATTLARFRNILEEPVFKLEDSKRYLFMPTPLGLVALSDKTSIEGFVRKAVPKGKALNIEIDRIGGVLNSVYLIRFEGEKEKQHVVVKRFKDWYGLKWFPLALWAIGTRGFSVLGRSRLEKEYAINRFLSTQGIRVPKILYVSPDERLIFEEFVEGLNLVEVLKNLSSKKMGAKEAGGILREVGKTLAKVHKTGVALGDCKPENIVITRDRSVCFLDLEQASRGGNQVWDVAEFLFYAGHYFPSVLSLQAVKLVTNESVRGYLENGGSPTNISKAASARYGKVFSIFTPPHVLITISNCLKKAVQQT